MQCPRKFFYSTICKLRSAATEATTKGTLAHTALEEIFELPQGERTPERAAAFVAPAWAELRDDPDYAGLVAEGPEFETRLIAQAEQLTRNLWKMENPDVFDPIGRELRVAAEAAGVPLHGIIDRLDRVVYPSGAVRWTLSDYKGLALDTPLPTPTGWTTMADVQAGDLLLDAAGQPTKVVAKSEVHHRPCYRIDFDDASSIVCDNEHLWSIHYRPGHQRKRWESKVLNADELYERVITRTSNQDPIVILNTSPLEFEEAKLPIDPYVLGYWLGDGRNRNGELTVADSDAPFVLQELASRGERLLDQTSPSSKAHSVRQIVVTRPHEDRCWHGHPRPGGTKKECGDCVIPRPKFPVNGSLGMRLKSLNLLHNKHVPAKYLRASEAQRLDLLRGLMDSDGHWNPTRNQAVFSTTTRVLAEAVSELVVSLGARAYTHERPSENAKLPPQIAFMVTFTPTDFNPFFLPRKADLWRAGGIRSRRRAIARMEPVASVPTQCVAVDSPDSLYLAGHQMVPTHNTGKVPRQGDRFLDEKFFGLRVYAVLLDAMLSIKVDEARLIYVAAAAPSGIVSLPIDDAVRQRTTAQLKSVWKGINRAAKTGCWDPKTGPLCNWCDFQDICPAFATELDGIPISS